MSSDDSVTGWLEGLNNALELEINNSEIVSIEEKGEERNWIAKHHLVRSKKHKIHHLAIGFNKNAKDPFNHLQLSKIDHTYLA